MKKLRSCITHLLWVSRPDEATSFGPFPPKKLGKKISRKQKKSKKIISEISFSGVWMFYFRLLKLFKWSLFFKFFPFEIAISRIWKSVDTLMIFFCLIFSNFFFQRLPFLKKWLGRCWYSTAPFPNLHYLFIKPARKRNPNMQALMTISSQEFFCYL